MYIEPYANLGHVPHCSLKIQTTIGDQYNNNTPHKNTGKTLQFTYFNSIPDQLTDQTLFEYYLTKGFLPFRDKF